MKLSLRQLEIFAAIARTENVSQAAERLSMSQSAASSALVALEKQFDCPLFDRIGKTLHLNGTGRGLLPQAEALLRQAREIESYLGGGQLGPITVGATLTIGNYLAPSLLADYLHQHPDSKIQLVVANTQAIIEQLLRFECDLALIEGEARHPDLLVEPWREDELVIFCAPGNPLAGVAAPTSAQLARQAWVLREPGSGTRGWFDRQVAPQLGPFQIRFELEHTEAIKQAVVAGLGISCLSRLALVDALQRGSLVELATPQFKLKRPFYFVRHQQRLQSPAIQRYWEICQGYDGRPSATPPGALG